MPDLKAVYRTRVHTGLETTPFVDDLAERWCMRDAITEPQYLAFSRLSDMNVRNNPSYFTRSLLQPQGATLVESFPPLFGSKKKHLDRRTS